MSDPLKLTRTQARQVALKAALLDNKNKFQGKLGVKEVIDHLGYIQIDTISVIERAHHHVLWSRIPDYKPEQIDKLQAVDKQIYEYWGHAMSYLPMDDFRFYKHIYKKFKNPTTKYSKSALEKSKHHFPKVLRRIRKEGALSAKDFEHTSDKKRSGWWDWKLAKIALEFLFYQGKLMIVGRKNFQKYYDLTERVLPETVNRKSPTKKELARFWINRALTGFGLASLSEIKEYLYNTDKNLIEGQIKQLFKSNELCELRIENLKESYFIKPAMLDNFESSNNSDARLCILSPFDPFVINRKRLQKLFNFEYSIECYLPESKRKYGYFVLPILWREKIIGRIDVKADRAKETLIIKNLFVEENFKPSKLFYKSLIKELQSFKMFNKCQSISISKKASTITNRIVDFL